MRPRPHGLLPLLAALALALGCQTAAQAPPGEAAAQKAPPEPAAADTFEPARGVVCDRAAKDCTYRGGPSVGLTRLFFGQAAAEAVAPQVRSIGYPNDPIFRPPEGGHCDTLVTTCYGDDGPSKELTARYFGEGARELLAERMRKNDAKSGIFRVGQFVTCDRMSGVCYDRLGAGYGPTRMYLGEAEAKALLRRLRPWGPEA